MLVIVFFYSSAAIKIPFKIKNCFSFIYGPSKLLHQHFCPLLVSLLSAESLERPTRIKLIYCSAICASATVLAYRISSTSKLGHSSAQTALAQAAVALPGTPPCPRRPPTPPSVSTGLSAPHSSD